MKCPYCGGSVSLKSSWEIYRSDYGYVYVCDRYPDCNSYVGTHKKTLKPLGRLANKELRLLKIEAHEYFDAIWKYRKDQGLFRARLKAYKWLSQELNLNIKNTHIGYFDIETTRKVIAICKPFYEKIKKIEKIKKKRVGKNAY